MNYQLTLLEIAFDDLRSAELLYQHNLHPQAIFFLQQSVEKVIKQLGINNGVIKPNELMTKVGHKPEIIFKKIVKQIKHLTNETDGDIDKSYNELKQLINNKNLHELKDVILEQLSHYRSLSIGDDGLSAIIRTIIVKIKPTFYDELESNQTLKQSYEGKLKQFIDAFPDYIKSVLMLFVINSVISGHVSSVRYPEEKSFDNPSRIYNAQHALIELMPTFIDDMKFIVKSTMKSSMIFM